MPSSSANPNSEIPEAGETILLVEDAAFVREVTCEVLESAGYVVLSASSAEQALNAFRQHPGLVDLLVTDLCLPGKNGRVLASELGSLSPGTKIILISGYAENSVQGTDENPGFVYFPKPFSAQSLLRRIREVLDSGETAAWKQAPANGEVAASR